jgi:glutaminase
MRWRRDHQQPQRPDRSPIRRYLEELHARLSKLDTGRVATYIPELARADPAWFGLVIATVDGHVYEVAPRGSSSPSSRFRSR